MASIAHRPFSALCHGSVGRSPGGRGLRSPSDMTRCRTVEITRITVAIRPNPRARTNIRIRETTCPLCKRTWRLRFQPPADQLLSCRTYSRSACRHERSAVVVLAGHDMTLGVSGPTVTAPVAAVPPTAPPDTDLCHVVGLHGSSSSSRRPTSQPSGYDPTLVHGGRGEVLFTFPLKSRAAPPVLTPLRPDRTLSHDIAAGHSRSPQPESEYSRRHARGKHLVVA